MALSARPSVCLRQLLINCFEFYLYTCIYVAGGIGSSVLLYLAAAGVGQLHVVDFDKVELSNLHRQILHDEAGAAQGENKAHSAVRRLAQLNSSVTVVAHDVRLNPKNALSLLAPMDIVVDATDNLETRYLLSDACVLLGKPLVAGSAVALAPLQPASPQPIRGTP